MNDTEKLREIATSILEQSHDDSVARNAGELLKLSAEIDNHRADARKLAIEEQKISSEVSESRNRQKSEGRKAYIALLAPVFTTLILAGTLVMQSYQFQQSEKDKQVETRRQAELAENMRWTESVKLLRESDGISPAGILLKSFANSSHAALAYKTAVEILLKTDEPQAFENLFGSVFDPVDWNNLPQVVDLNRTVESQRSSLSLKAWDNRRKKIDETKLNITEKLQLGQLDTKVQFITARLAPTLRGPRPAGGPLDLRSTDLWVGDLRGADLRGANLSDADLTFLDLEGADLSGITEYQQVRFTASAWWRASKIEKGLLEHLERTYPLNASPYVYNSKTPVSTADYEAGVKRLRQSASRP